MDHDCLTAVLEEVVVLPRSDRWQVCTRLQELDILCTCLDDGTLRVSVADPLTALQLWSVVTQLTAPRPTLIHFLNRCWLTCQ